MNIHNVTTIEVIETQSIADRIVVVGQLTDGDVRQGMLLQSDGGSRFEVAGVGFVPVEAYRAGKRAMTLIKIGKSDLNIGDRLKPISK